MARAGEPDLFPDVGTPEGTTVVNDRCLVRTQDRHRVVIVSGVVLAQYAVGDQMAEAYAMVSLVEQGWADQNDVARAFARSARSLRRASVGSRRAGSPPWVVQAATHPAGHVCRGRGSNWFAA